MSEELFRHLEHIWHPSRVTIIEYNIDNYRNTWIPIKWVPLDNDSQAELARVIDSKIELSYGQPVIVYRGPGTFGNHKLFRFRTPRFLNRFKTAFIRHWMD